MPSGSHFQLALSSHFLHKPSFNDKRTQMHHPPQNKIRSDMLKTMPNWDSSLSNEWLEKHFVKKHKAYFVFVVNLCPNKTLRFILLMAELCQTNSNRCPNWNVGKQKLHIPFFALNKKSLQAVLLFIGLREGSASLCMIIVSCCSSSQCELFSAKRMCQALYLVAHSRRSSGLNPIYQP